MNLSKMREWASMFPANSRPPAKYHVSAGNVVHRESCQYYKPENLMTAQEIRDTIRDVRLCRVCGPRI